MIKTIIPKLPFVNKEETLDFYINHLHCTLLSDYGDYFLINLDEAELHFFSFPALNAKASDFMIYLRMDTGIETLYQKLIIKGIAKKDFGRFEVKPIVPPIF